MVAAQGQNNSAAGHIAFTVVLTNDSAQSCTLEGFPTVQLSASGQNVATNQTDGNPPAGAPESLTPTLVTFTAGAAGSFVFQYIDVPSGNQECNSASALQITLPGGGGTVTASANVAPCGGDIYVSPVRAGTAAP